jgi:hypothetical protein
MRDLSTTLLTNVLRATVETLRESANIDQAEAQELKHTLLEQIARLQANHLEPQATSCDA